MIIIMNHYYYEYLWTNQALLVGGLNPSEKY